MMQVYAPKNAADDKDKDDFYELLHDVLDSIPKQDMKIMLRDFIAQVGADSTGWEEAIGEAATRERNDNGERLVSNCSSNKFKVGGNLFQTQEDP